MKNLIKSTTAIFLVFIFVFSFAACGEKEPITGLWENAVYTEDTELGSGEKTVTVEVKTEDKIVTFTIKTDAATVGAALTEHGLISGDEGAYGLYIKEVNGIVADYDIDQTYWAFYIDGEYAMSGIDLTEITEGAVYQLVRSK